MRVRNFFSVIKEKFSSILILARNAIACVFLTAVREDVPKRMSIAELAPGVTFCEGVQLPNSSQVRILPKL